MKVQPQLSMKPGNPGIREPGKPGTGERSQHIQTQGYQTQGYQNARSNKVAPRGGEYLLDQVQVD